MVRTRFEHGEHGSNMARTWFEHGVNTKGYGFGRRLLMDSGIVESLNEAVLAISIFVHPAAMMTLMVMIAMTAMMVQ
eukprot:10192895-Lingulodinium_polyedra.AAC.1